MKVRYTSALAALLLMTLAACGGPGGDGAAEVPATPSLPFTEVAPLLPLTAGPLANHLIFANDIPPDQIQTLKQDLAIIDNWDGLMTTSESGRLRELLDIDDPTPASLSLWFKARMKYILKSDLKLYQLGLVFNRAGQVGLQELGSADEDDEVNTGGGNIGTAIYLTTLEEQQKNGDLAYLIIRINDSWVPVLSPRVGLMRIGPALFDPNFQVNHSNLRALSNSLQRIEVLFHEARHSDGNQAAGSVGFPHINCPNDSTIPTELVGIPACDASSNGAYSVGAAVLKALMHLCERRCTVGEQEVLKAVYLDRISRVAINVTAVKELDPAPEKGFNSVDISDFQAFNLR